MKIKCLVLLGLLLTAGSIGFAQSKTNNQNKNRQLPNAIAVSASEIDANEPSNAQDDFDGSPCGRFPKETIFDSFEKAFRSPDKARCLNLAVEGDDLNMKSLPSGLDALVNLEVFSFGCLEQLEKLPEEIGNLRRLEELIIDNGNGCTMNVSLPGSIGKLKNLRVLKLYGALDAGESDESDRSPKIKNLPDSIADLQNLEVLDLGRNGLTRVPPQIARLPNLKILRLDFNALSAVPDFVGNFASLQELALDANEHIVNLPASMAKFKRLRISMGGNALKLREQKSLRSRFPRIVFSFKNEFDDARANEEVPKPKAKRRPQRKR